MLPKIIFSGRASEFALRDYTLENRFFPLMPGPMSFQAGFLAKGSITKFANERFIVVSSMSIVVPSLDERFRAILAWEDKRTLVIHAYNWRSRPSEDF